MVTLEGDRLRVRGPVNMETVPALVEAGTPLVARARVVDLAATEALDSAALALVLAWQREAMRGAGRPLVVENAPDAFANLARLYGVTDFLRPAA